MQIILNTAVRFSFVVSASNNKIYLGLFADTWFMKQVSVTYRSVRMGPKVEVALYAIRALGRSLLDNRLELPYTKFIPVVSIEFPYYFVDDVAFPL